MIQVISIIVSAAAAAAAYAGYASMSPGTQLYGRTRTRGRNPQQIALTYDDGPNDPHTLRLLEVLARHDARATFFLIGRYVRQRPDIVRAIRDAGHAIGNHTYSHPNLALVSPARLCRELEDCHKALQDAIGDYQPLFRPPFGGKRPDVLRAARRMGLEPVMWSVTAYDWSAKSSDSIVGHATRQMGPRDGKQGEIILLHDGGHLEFGADRSHTVEATRRLLEKYSAEGKRFVAIPDLE
ncbi:MAG TPA: polysaccharide deacetylase family protein [Candidatus Saccharimonadales bacterium]|jgi:peptidoglycan/xylan/chitin deacetylase (PgdA/CDA1 family)|nr:polysaccharide deacetylase family protein [Candidatus Saccharimonadales bacterium]